MPDDPLFLSAGERPFKTGLPLGSLGTGKMEISPSGRFDNLTIRNNWSGPLTNEPTGAGKGLLGFHFAIRVKQKNKITVRLLEHADKGAGRLKTPGWPGVSKVSYKGAFPKAVLSYEEKQLPVKVRLTALSPVIPHDYDASSLPGFLLFFDVENRTREPLEVSLLVIWRNLSGSYAIGRANRLEKNSRSVAIHFENKEKDRHDPHMGSMTLSLTKRPRQRISFLTQWNLFEEHFRMDRLINLMPLASWGRTGELPNSMDSEPVLGGSNTWAGALAAGFRLGPREASRVSAAASWHFPNAPEGHIYAKKFSHSKQAASWLNKHERRIEKSVNEWHGVLKTGDLPPWLTTALCNNLSPLVSASRWARDGRFYLYEAPVVCPYLGTLDVRFYGSLPLALLFPELEKSELLEFVRAQRADGYIPHDLGWTKPYPAGNGTTPFYWKDLCPKFALLAYRDVLWSRDWQLLKKVYPSVKRALEWERNQDTNGDLLPDHEGADQTFDLWSFQGASSYVSGLYLAALLAARQMAIKMRDDKAAGRYLEIFKGAQTSFIQKLWNGRYFLADQSKNYSHACVAAQLTGQWYADLLGLGNIVPPPLIERSIKSILRLNGNASDYGVVNAVSPNGQKISPNRHAKNIFVGVSYSVAALAVHRGEISKGLALAKKTWENVALTQRDPWNQPDMVSSDDGRFMFGDSYMRNMSLWALPLALAKHRPSVARMIRRLGAPGGVRVP